MNFDAFLKKVNKLRSNNPELIDNYEDATGESLYENLSEAHALFEKLVKVQPNADPINFVQSALGTAINTGISAIDAMEAITNKASMPGGEKSPLQQYFHEISKTYEKHNNDYNIVYCPENREKLIEMNLKTVISIAKGYQGLGLSLEDLIGAGNLGLVVSFDKYDPNRAKLKEDMIDSLSDLPEDADEQIILQHIQKFLTYGDIKKKFAKSFGISEKKRKVEVVKTPRNEDEEEDEEEILDVSQTTQYDTIITGWKPFTKGDIIKWIKRNVKNATFNSVAFMWIRAYILIEIDNCSRLVKKPKSEIYNDKLKYGAYRKEITLDIDAPVSADGDTCFRDILNIEDDTPSDTEISEAYDVYKEGLNKLLDGVKPRDRAVFLKKFGIGLPRPMSPKEIAEQENLSIARISQIFQGVVEQMRQNQIKYNINIDMLFDAARKID